MARNDPHAITSLNAQVNGYKGGSDMEDSDIGQVFYVNNDTTNLLIGAEPGADVSGAGKSPLQPFATIDYAIGQCLAGRGDKIIVLQGHSDTVTAAITMDVAGVTIEGRGQGANRAQVSCATASIDMLTITAANCVVRNLLFNESTADVSAMVNVAAADALIEDCQFDLGATDEECITWASGSRLTVKGNLFNVTANGPDRAIEIESTNDGLVCVKNVFNGGSTTNAWDDSAIHSAQAHTNALIDDNVFMYGIALVVATSVSTSVGNRNQYLMGAPANAGAPMTIYADNGSTVRDGKSMATPTTVANAISKCRSGAGDTVLLLPGTYTQSAAYALNVVAMRFGPAIDNGAFNVTFTTASDVDLITLTGASVEVWGIRFVGNAAQTTTPALIDLDTGDFCHIHDCYFDAVSVASLVSIDVAATATDTKISRNYFVAQAATVGSIVDLGARTLVLDNICNQVAADGYFINNDGMAVGGSIYARNYLLGDGGSNAAMCLFDTTAPVAFLATGNIFGGTTSNTPFTQDSEYTSHFVNNYAAGNTVSGGFLIDPVA